VPQSDKLLEITINYCYETHRLFLLYTLPLSLHVYIFFLEQWNTIVGLQSARTNHLQDRARINKARTASQDKSGVIAGIVALHATERVATWFIYYLYYLWFDFMSSWHATGESSGQCASHARGTGSTTRRTIGGSGHRWEVLGFQLAEQKCHGHLGCPSDDSTCGSYYYLVFFQASSHGVI